MKYILASPNPMFCLLLSFLIITCNQELQSQNLDQTANIKRAQSKGLNAAVFAGGCFWCLEEVFDNVKGVTEAVSGYSGGAEKEPTYKAVGSGLTSHAEAVLIYYDPKVISFETLLEIFFAVHNPTTLNRQGPDAGKQYRSAVYYKDEKEQKLTKEYIAKLTETKKFKDPIVTEVAGYTNFYIAESYHQNYYKLNPNDRYIQNVTKPKIERFRKEFRDKLKPGK